jgi:hypothetical protein
MCCDGVLGHLSYASLEGLSELVCEYRGVTVQCPCKKMDWEGGS